MSGKTCSINGCERPAKGRGWCHTHWRRWRRHGDPEAVVLRQRSQCSVEDCERDVKRQGMCHLHAQRVLRSGATELPPRPDIKQRFWAKVQPFQPGGCWLWTGARNRKGYGFLHRDGHRGAKEYAHRLAYGWYRGPIPNGLHIDHLCRNTSCVNPAHLEAVTPRENDRRARAARAAMNRG